MKDPLVVKRYAEAFWSFAGSTMGPQKCLQDLRNLRKIIRENPAFTQVLESPQITRTEKTELIRKLLDSDFSDQTRDFLIMLLAKERIELLGDIMEYVRRIWGHPGVIEALLKTAYPLDLELLEAIKDSLQKKYHKRFKLYIDLDGRLLGGVQLVIGNTVLDGTVAGRLAQLKEMLKSVRVN